MAEPCPFCPENAEYVVEVGSAAALWDNYPVNPGHVLVVPVVHRRNLFECTPEELADMWAVIERMKELLTGKYRPDGFNIGANVGRCAGQTVFHCHIHLIPRFENDTDSPRGGVRRVKEPLVEY